MRLFFSGHILRLVRLSADIPVYVAKFLNIQTNPALFLYHMVPYCFNLQTYFMEYRNKLHDQKNDFQEKDVDLF